MTERSAILVVEDDPLVSEVIAAALDDGYPSASSRRLPKP